MAAPNMQIALLYHFCRLRLPGVAVPLEKFSRRLERGFERYRASHPEEEPVPTWQRFIENLHALDWFLASACLEGLNTAWEALFNARANRTDLLLIDALRSRAVRLFPRDADKQDEAVTDFWGYILAGEREGSVPILERYDGQRPLVPWLICVFHNKALSEMRKQRGEAPLPEDDFSQPDPYDPEESKEHWHDQFRDLAREWFATLKDEEVLLLGLRLRYRLSQREVAKFLGIHEGNITRRVDAINKKCHERIGQALRELGWTGDDLYAFIRKEMYSVLLEEPRMSVDRLAALLTQRGKEPPPDPS